MNDVAGFSEVPTTTLADLLGRDQVMDIGIRPLWPSAARVAVGSSRRRSPGSADLGRPVTVDTAARGWVYMRMPNRRRTAVSAG